MYPKIFGEDTSDIEFLDIDINEATDMILSGGWIIDNKTYPTNHHYPLLIVHSLTTTAVKWALTDFLRTES